ncbi:MAG: hypothetical protein OXB84_04075 [Halobacteriovoraceae bacterium]|nr:hypothetical protein [Halobacteriovoraceae bacterium]
MKQSGFILQFVKLGMKSIAVILVGSAISLTALLGILIPYAWLADLLQ